MNASQLINQTSGEVEYYTPAEIIEAARATMGSIDLDPASSSKANEVVKAAHFHTQDDDGLKWSWFGHVWLNHPFGRKTNKPWIERLVRDYLDRRFMEACCITFACTSENWFRPLLDYPQCFLYGRTNYRLPDGTIKRGVTKGSVVTYLGPNIWAFRRHFDQLGRVKV